VFGLPVDLLEKFDEIGVGVGLVLFGLSGDDIDGEEGIGLAL
jgi:hypothetical protein